MARPAIFEGELTAGRTYFLVDDFVGQGGTLANLRGFILHHGGHVVGAITLTGRGDSAKLALTADTLESLAARVFDAECEALPKALNLIAAGRVSVQNGMVNLA